MGSNYATNNVEVMRADDNSLWNHYRRLVQIRAASPALRRGTFQRIATGSDQVLAFLRWHDPKNWPLLRDALKRMGRADLIGNGDECLVPAGKPTAAKPAPPT